MNTETTDPKAAAVHRAQAERHYDAAERLRKLGLTTAEADARRFAKHEDDLAFMLETGREPRRAS